MSKFKGFLEEKGINEEQAKAKSIDELMALHSEFQEKNRKEIEDLVNEKISRGFRFDSKEVDWR